MAPRRKASGRPADAEALFDRTPPQSLDAERSVLGAMLLNPNAVGAAIEILQESSSETFYVAAHQRIYEAAVALFKRNMPVDPVTLLEQLSRDGTLESSGGASYIAELTTAVPTSANIEHYARLVLESALLRKIITTCTRIAGEAYQPDDSVDKLLDRAEADIFSIAERRQLNPVYRIGDLLEDGIHRIEEQIKSQTGVTGVGTGYGKLDELLSGFQPSDMIILAARPSVGKTAFALNIAANASTELGRGVLMFSLEMSKEQLVQRLLCMVGHVDSQRLRSGYLARGEFHKLPQAADKLSRANLYIDETPNINVLELRSKARRHAAQHTVDLVIIDYLQLMTTGGRAENRQVEIAEISRAIKGLARQLRVPVLALSQLSREAEKDDSGIPKLSHLRESGAIEQDADVVLMLSRPKAYESEGRDNVLRLDVAKQRNGPTGFVELLFEKSYQRFHSLVEGAGAPVREPDSGVAFDAASYEEDDTPF